MNKPCFSLVLILMLVMSVAACKDGDSTRFVEAIEAGQLEILGIRIETDNPIVNADGYSQYAAFGLPIDSTASEVDISNKVRWSLANDTLATINSNGLLLAKTDGDVNVIAEFANYRASSVQRINTSFITGITITGVADVDECQNLQLKAEGAFADGSIRPISDVVTWSVTSGEAIIGSNAILKTFAAGTVAVTAESEGILGNAEVSVIDSLQTITLSPLAPSIVQGSTLSFSAIGNYAAQQLDITNNGTWSSADTSVAAFDNSAEYEQVSAPGVGATTIQVACGGVTADTTLTVI